MSAIDHVNKLVTATEKLLQPQLRAPTRAELGIALEHADAAMEAAADARLSAYMIAMCEDLQHRCHDLLRRSYSRTESYEKFVYEKANASRSPSGPNRKRCGKVFEVDKGEHLVEALQAVQFERMLEDRESAEEAQARRIRFVDEVKDEPIRQVQDA
ncbi:hypothetical protein GGR53DRAFT_466305 [Hypoxylon sp. FL1150]|nr:hypothetical protein GGR53DRAFT_466305 [Hypoxylon sp. FL1150]